MTWIKPDDLLGYIEGFQNEGVGNYIFSIGQNTHWLEIANESLIFSVGGAGNLIQTSNIELNQYMHVAGVLDLKSNYILMVILKLAHH